MSGLNDSTRPNNGRRIASAQAWKRLWNHVRWNELNDIASDIAQYVMWRTDSELTELQQRAIAEALASFPWDRQQQA
jgi:hypothetical protein